MNYRIISASLILLALILLPTPIVLSQSSTDGTISAQYKDIDIVVRDKYRGLFEIDYKYDWDTNTFTVINDTPSTQDPENTIVIDGDLSEDVWNDIQPITINLEATKPWGSAIDKVSVRAGNNGSWVFLSFEWEDSTESRSESSRIKNPDGSFFYNETHHYSDNFYVGWWMNEGKPTVEPWFNAHFAGTTMGRVPWKDVDTEALASLWIYKAYYVDDEAQKWPKPYFGSLEKFLFGQHKDEPQRVAYPHMIEMYLNSTANYAITYMSHVSGCAFPDQDFFPFEVRANGAWKDGRYSLEIARPFEPHPQNAALDATPVLQSGEEFEVFFGAADGHVGENEDVGSISDWFTLSIESAPSNAISIELVAGLVAIVAVVLGIAVFRRTRK
jgi:hypothetical protein